MQATEPANAAAASANAAAEDAAQRLPELPEWVPEVIDQAWQYLLQYPLLAAAAIVVIGYLAAKVAQAVITRGIARMTARTKTNFDDQLISLLHRPVFLTVFILGLTLATRSLDLPPTFTKRTIQVLWSLVLLNWLSAGLPIMRLVLDALGRHRERFSLIEERTIPLFDITAKLVLVGGGAWVLLQIWNIDATAWLASAGVIGIAVGFAAKDTLANLFSGFFIVADAPYKLGDFIVLESGDRGQVTHVGIRSTRILTRDDIEITLPNAMIANTRIINESGGPWEKHRIRIAVGVAYGSDLDQVCAVLEQVAKDHPHVCADPAPRVRMRAFGASSLDFELLCWIDQPVLRGRMRHQLLMAVYKALDQAAIEIPYAKQDLYIKEMPASSALSR